ncbi:TonB-dependent receptor [Sphingomonas sp. HF-S4]|uniref:TonB-dependent receptor n=1 Tax=Sphingomonas agrestis TaxID=3080540 RepID=A0ABU3Y733_9SPHN|nr:TonB-dependent receptor [Sphingomonas sp. HF-S4]MDV3457109.1 TonB-dependent receptor [Sphingomonas sp. HF-S4]
MKNRVAKTRLAYLGRAATVALAIGVAMPALAQEVPVAPAEDTAQNDAIVVTGSRIRGIEPVGSNVIAIDQDRILAEPVTSTNDLLRRVPQVVSLGANRAGGSAQNGAANATRGAGINLRGLSTQATLLLYDGKRFPPQGTQGQFTDPSVIPSIALGRVEVVADGASAIYGSDAVAGVVNFILRKDINGIETRARYGFTDAGYNEKQFAAIAGKTWSGGHLTIAGEYTQNDPLYGAALDFYQNDNRPNGGRDLRNANCAPGTITAGGGTYAIPASGVTPATAGTLVRGTRNLCFYGGAEPIISEQDRISVVGSFSQDLAPGLRVFADGFYSRREGVLTIAPNVNATVTNANPFYVNPTGGTGPVTVTYSLFPDTGLLANDYYGTFWNASAGVEAKLFGDFEATFYYAHGQSEDVADRRRSGINAAALTAALADTNPATALNVFGGRNNPATLARITDNLFIITGRTKLDVFNLQADGSLFQLPGGAVRIAVGGEHRIEHTYTDLITGQAATPRSLNDAGTRNVDAVFGELFVPIFGAGNAVPGLEQLSLSLALRHENYSDFGSTTNPKIGLTYKPVQGVTLRGSYGTSFRAPTFAEVSTVAGGAGLYFDTLPGPTGNLTGIGIAGGNPDLTPETATTWSFGAEIAPIDGLSASLTYFRIDYTDQIQALRGTPGLLTNPIYASFVQFNPTPTQVDALVNSGLPINAAINNSLVTFIADGRRQNLGTSLMRGLDFSLRYDRAIGDVRLDAGIQGTYLLDYKFEAVPGSGLVDVRDSIGIAQRYRHQADIGLSAGGLRGRVTWNHLAGYYNTGVTPRQRISNYDTLDFYLGYEVDERLTLSVDVRNMFDEDPPYVDIAGGYDPQAANPVPRLFSVTAAVKF